MSNAFISIFDPLPDDERQAMRLDPVKGGYLRNRGNGTVMMAMMPCTIVSAPLMPWLPNLETQEYRRRLRQLRGEIPVDKPKFRIGSSLPHSPEKVLSGEKRTEDPKPTIQKFKLKIKTSTTPEPEPEPEPEIATQPEPRKLTFKIKKKGI